jgi:1-acyl-sn-glycerol-3-phosphate acyltransferase
MSTTWHGDDAPDPANLTAAGWLRVVARGLPLGILVFGCLVLLLLVRLVERPLHGRHRPWTPWITQFVCRNAFRILGMSFTVSGRVMTGAGATVANHSSWLDIFALNACDRIYFVSKAEVSGWPGIGWLARATGTVFIQRNRTQARAHTQTIQQRLSDGHRLVFFPEGTSSDGLRVLPFKTTLFASFLSGDLREDMQIQPVSVTYTAPPVGPDRFYGWWGDMGFGPHLLKILGARQQGGVHLSYLPPLRVADYQNRKELARHLEQAVRQAHQDARA